MLSERLAAPRTATSGAVTVPSGSVVSGAYYGRRLLSYGCVPLGTHVTP